MSDTFQVMFFPAFFLIYGIVAVALMHLGEWRRRRALTHTQPEPNRGQSDE